MDQGGFKDENPPIVRVDNEWSWADVKWRFLGEAQEEGVIRKERSPEEGAIQKKTKDALQIKAPIN